MCKKNEKLYVCFKQTYLKVILYFKEFILNW